MLESYFSRATSNVSEHFIFYDSVQSKILKTIVTRKQNPTKTFKI
jgi:hypothetical protein